MTERRLAGAGVACLVALACGGRAMPKGEVGPARAEAGAAAQQPLTEVAALHLGLDSLVHDPRFRSAIWGILIVDPDAADTLYSLNAGKLFLPASNMKIVTGATALVALGPDYQYRTTYAVRGRIRRGVVDGDLVVIGRGDPTVSDHMAHSATVPLRAAAESLAAHGIRRITGRIIAGGDAFPDANLGYGWDWDDLNEPYAAGVDELMLNEGYTTVVVHGGVRAGAPATVATAPAATYPALRNHVRTVVPTGDAPAPAITVTYDSLTWALVVGGSIAPHDSATALVPYRDPAAAYLHALETAIAARGIRLRAHAADASAPDTPTAHTETARGASAPLDTVFTMLSPPLRDVLPALLKPSQNQIAEVLLKTIGLERTGVGSADSGIRVVHDQLLAWGAAPDGFVVHDGSGLSRHDYLSPETLVHTLVGIRRDSAFQTFYESLPIAGVDGTIADRMRGTLAAGNVRAKTGFVDRARSLSGYVTTADGVPLVFSLLCNNWTTSVRDVERVQDEIATRLAGLALRRR